MEIKKKNSKTLILSSLKEYVAFAILFLCGLFLFSFLEIISFNISQNLPHPFLSLFSKSLILDVFFWLNLIFPVGLIYLLIYLLSRTLANLVFSIVFVLFFVIHLVLISYYHTSLVLLGSDLFGYSIDDITQTVGASGVLSLSSLLLFSISIGLVILGLYYLKPKIRIHQFVCIGLFGISFLIFIIDDFDGLKPKFQEDFSNNLILNKSAHFYKAAYDYNTETGYSVDIYASNYLELLDQRLEQQGRFEYLNSEFPFLHEADTTDVLSVFFEKNNTPPNIVIIVVEGLGRAFTNDGAYLGNFTPFLDSLSQKSLYFKNFLSNGGRTFAVLPSLLGSEPFAQNGFLELKETMPAQLSLINILQKNGYTSSYYYGGNATFDNMSGYLNLNKTNNIFDQNSFTEAYSKLPKTGGFTWGYGDQELYDFYLSKSPSDTISKPRLDILLTVTTHSPFVLNEQSKYLKRFEDRLNTLDLDKTSMEQRRNFDDEFATVLYADDALKSFFKNYSKRTDFKNTIFLITGDHRIPEIPLSTKIDRYHVPLIVYSPMLKHPKEINAISSHFDVAPSILNYLSNSYDIKIPKQNSFLSKGLDTSATFRNIHQIPMMQTKTDLVDFVSGSYHLNGDQLYKLDSNLYEEEVLDSAKKEELQAAFADFKRRNQKIAQGSKLVPDSLVTKYAQ